MSKKLILLILDGLGHSSQLLGNAVKEAYMPTLRMIERNYPSCLLQASGLAVGLPFGEAGNSEVGHLNIGAGRIVEQYLPRINRSIADGSFSKIDALHGAFIHAKSRGGIVHLAGLLTSGTVHASFTHLVGILDFALEYKDVPLFLHCFTDGKDGGLQEGVELIEKLELELQKRGLGKIVTIVGRKIAMDRDNNWPSTEKTYKLMTQAKGEIIDSAKDYLQSCYDKDLNDQIIEPAVLRQNNFTGIKDGDSLIFWNFREDAIRQIARAFFEPGFNKFAISVFNDLYGATMTLYQDNLNAKALFPLPNINNSLAEVLSLSGLKQYHITETEKYAHVTYFFDGLKESPFENEEWEFVETDRDFINLPEMRSAEISEKIVSKIKDKDTNFIVANFPNGDILAHTGNLEATIKGLEAIDRVLLNIYDVAVATRSTLFITSDHGNAESLIYTGSGERETRHDDSPVPFFLVANEHKNKTGNDWKLPNEADGVLADVAPTILEIFDIQKPAEMSGESLLRLLFR